MLAPSELEKKDKAYAENIGGNIEAKAFEIIDDPNRRYRTIILNGGFNDIFNRAYHKENPDNIADEVISSYTRIIEAAHMAGIQIVLFTIIHKGNLSDSDPRNMAIQKVNEWILAESDADAIVDADILKNTEIAGDGFHPNSKGQERLYRQIKDVAINED